MGVLATLTEEGRPHAAVIYFSVDTDFRFTFVTKKGTSKYKNLQHDSHAVLIVFDENSQTTVQIQGVAEQITETESAETAFNHMLEAAQLTSDGEVPPISKIFAGDYVSYFLKPSYISMSVFVRPDPSGYDLHEAIEFKD